ncbi:MAG: two-component regulator propeller domain-containing protein [Balneolaceae bacterium]
MKRFLFLFIINAIVAQTTLSAQGYPFRTYSIEDGLSEAVVHAIVQDHEGSMWLGTGYGLNRFNGIEFQNYYEDQGLQSSKIFALFEDSQHRLWIGTGQGVNYWMSDSIYYSNDLSALDELQVTSIFEDLDGDLWFATDGGGVWVLNKNNELTQYSKAQGFKSDIVRKIVQTKDGVLWFATRNGLTKLAYGNIRTYGVEDGLPDEKIRDIILDENGTLWIATRNGLAKYKNEVFTTYNEKQGLNNLRVQTLNIDLYKRLWLGTENGVSVLEDGKFRNFTMANGLSNGIIYSSTLDREGNLWFGTFGGGVNLFLGDYFENYTSDLGLANDVVTSFAESDDGTLWVGTYGGGISQYKNSTFKTFSLEQGLKDDKVYTLTYDSKKRMWVGLRDGLAIIENGQIKNFKDSEFPYRKVRHIYETKNGDFWISTYDEGVIRYDGKTFHQFTVEDGLAYNTTLGAVEDAEGNIWIATYGGVSKYNNGTFENYSMQEGLPNNAVMTIIVDNKGTVWVSTFGGIAWFNGKRFESITVEDGLPNRVCYFIEQSRDDLYWIGTNDGLARFNAEKFYSEIPTEKDQAFQLLSKEQGLISDEMNLGAVYEDGEGHLWVGSVEGMSHFIPTKYKGNPVSPQVKINEVLASGRLYENVEHLNLTYEQNFVEIFFSGINYNAPNRVLYEFKMDGIDPVWQRTTNRFAKYPSLPSGDYTFSVIARNTNGTWSEDVTKMTFSISAPFWQHWWFAVLIFLIVVSIIWLFYSYYKTTKLVDIERMRVRIASDLHDDVGASLTEIALQSDFLQAVDTNPELKKILSNIGAQSRKIVTSLDDIVWSIDSRNDTIGDLTDRMQDYLLNVLEPKNFKVEYNFEDLKMQNKLSVPLKENLYLIFKEAVNNISKYSNGDLVRITMHADGSNFVFTIYDNGSSSVSVKKTGHGLRNMTMRAERIGAKVDVSIINGFTITITGKLTAN